MSNSINLISVEDLNRDIERKLAAKRSTGAFLRRLKLEAWEASDQARIDACEEKEWLLRELRKVLGK